MADYMTAQGILTAKERQWLYDLARDVPGDGWIINIGIEYGASLVCLREGNPTAHLVGIDIIGDSKLASEVKDLIVICGDSAVVGQVWERADLVFVDGDHAHAAVLADATHWSACLMPTGRIAFHDCYPDPGVVWCGEVNPAVEEWLDLNHLQFTELVSMDSIRTFERNPEADNDDYG